MLFRQFDDGKLIILRVGWLEVGSVVVEAYKLANIWRFCVVLLFLVCFMCIESFCCSVLLVNANLCGDFQNFYQLFSIIILLQFQRVVCGARVH